MSKKDRITVAIIKLKRLETELAEAMQELEKIKIEVETPSEVYPEKTLAEELETITTFGFGLENYTIKGNHYERKSK